LQKYIVTEKEKITNMKSLLSRDYETFVAKYIPDQLLVENKPDADNAIIKQYSTNILDADPDIVARI